MFQTRDEALDALEIARREYVAQARAAAFVVASKMPDGMITIDDVRAVCPPPDGIDPRVMGTILRAPDWRKIGYTNSRRGTCHKRPVAIFERA